MIRPLFNATEIATIPHHMQDQNDNFRLSDADDTVDLGRAFSHAVRGMREISFKEQRPIRIGIRARSGTGKTTLVRGVLSAFNGYSIIEDVPDRNRQALRRHKNSNLGFLRNYDASLYDGIPGRAYGPLSSYICNDHDEYGLPFVDIVEHPKYDVHNTDFDCLIFMSVERWLDQRAARMASFLPSPEIRSHKGYQNFLKQAAVLQHHPTEKKTSAPRDAKPI